MDNFDLRKYLAEGRIHLSENITQFEIKSKEDVKFNDYVEVNQAEFDRLYDRLEDEFDGSVEDFVEEYGPDFLGPNIEAINQYYGVKVYADDVITDFFEAGGVDNISSNEEFEAWLDKNREFYI